MHVQGHGTSAPDPVEVDRASGSRNRILLSHANSIGHGSFGTADVRKTVDGFGQGVHFSSGQDAGRVGTFPTSVGISVKARSLPIYHAPAWIGVRRETIGPVEDFRLSPSTELREGPADRSFRGQTH